MKNIGLASGTVKLLPYSNNWQKQYEHEEAELKEVLQLEGADIQHVGSTAVPGMPAKPIIDIAILVADLATAETWIPSLNKIGYEYKGIEPDLPDRRFFAKGPKTNRTVYLHIVNEKEWNSLLKFRDLLRSNESAAKQYAQLKESLALKFPHNRLAYTMAKNEFISSIIGG